jgi:hypothetical protein
MSKLLAPHEQCPLLSLNAARSTAAEQWAQVRDDMVNDTLVGIACLGVTAGWGASELASPIRNPKSAIPNPQIT